MNSKVETTLYRTAAQIFEELGFILSSRELSLTQKDSPLAAMVTVGFKGPFQGKLVIRIYGQVIQVLAANMVGEEAPPSEDMQIDALKEMANVICGNLLPAIADADDVFDLSPPLVVESPDPGTARQPDPVAQACLGLDCGRAELLLYCSEGPASR